jgi:cardiolipin synthase (CMP-forming)
MQAGPSELKKSIPNMLTLLRVALACWLLLYIPGHYGEIIVPIGVSLAIFLTDFLDGRLARRWGCGSRAGAALDIAVDFFYILSMSILMCVNSIIPLWFICVVVYKFVEFIVTSMIFRAQSDSKQGLVFDFMGRIAAALFYVIPILEYAVYSVSRPAYGLLGLPLLYACAIPAFISTGQRIIRCIKEKGRFVLRPN